ncbi:MAG: two-component system response regulator BaeR [Desulfuromonas sp.]|nr:MAG: two-component system response regulator BaeR [Desulfuromonas sp.]
MTDAHILIIEDEVKLAKLLRDYLQQAGCRCSLHHRGDDALQRIQEENPDLVLLDIMLPSKDGMAICRALRHVSQVPVIMVTARVEEIDRLLGLELGADDYICKPFSPREVVARVKAVLKRSSTASTPPEGLQLDATRYRARLDGHDLDLTAVEFKLLEYLAASPGRIFSRTQLMDHIYPDQRIVSDRTIDSHIKKLRKKIAAADPQSNLVQSVYGVGYRLEEE